MLVCHKFLNHGLALSNLLCSSVILSKTVCISAFGSSLNPSNSLPYCRSIRFLFYVDLVAIFYSKIVQLLSHQVICMFSCHLPQFVGRVFFPCFGMLSFVCIVLPFVDIFFNFLSFAITFLFISSSCLVISYVAFFLSLHVSNVFPLFYNFCLFL